MKHSDAVRHLRAMLWTLQHMRSIGKETLAAWSEEAVQNVLEDLLPWVHTDKCPIPALVKVLDRVDDGGQIEPQEFFNFVFIATHLEPSLAFMIRTQDPDFPEEIDLGWIRGWEIEV